jgi:hypothetical protein
MGQPAEDREALLEIGPGLPARAGAHLDRRSESGNAAPARKALQQERDGFVVEQPEHLQLLDGANERDSVDDGGKIEERAMR